MTKIKCHRTSPELHIFKPHVIRIILNNSQISLESAQILFWLASHSSTIWNELSTIAPIAINRYRLYRKDAVQSRTHTLAFIGQKDVYKNIIRCQSIMKKRLEWCRLYVPIVSFNMTANYIN
jgi:hypothetical protein